MAKRKSARITTTLAPTIPHETHVNVPCSQSSRLSSDLAASGLCEHVTAESLACLEHVTAPDSSPIVPPGTHNLLPPRRLVSYIPTGREIRPNRLLPMPSHSLAAHIDIRNEIEF